MRNIVTVQDTIQAIQSIDANATITSYAYDFGLSVLLILTNNGRLHSFSVSDSNNCNSINDGEPMANGRIVSNRDAPWMLTLGDSLRDDDSSNDTNWFNVSILSESGEIVCVSHSGSIVSIKPSVISDGWQDDVCQEGCVDGGIAAAQWCPDQTLLVLITNNNSMLAMSNTWDVVQEIPIEPRLIASICSISWRSDGEYFTYLSTDAIDSIARVRVYNKDIELHSIGRNIADGSASLLKGVGSCVAFGSLGSLVAIPQQRVKKHHQIAFIEKNGLRHSDFDLTLPTTIPDGYDHWSIQSLHWDLPSYILAVGISAAIMTPDGLSQIDIHAPAVIQLYYRNNYHWYLKRQWSGIGMRCLGFDVEIVNRLYITQFVSIGNTTDAVIPAFRMIDISWDICRSSSADTTVAVVDGCDLLMTPIGLAIVPPPMFAYKIQLPHACSSVHLCNLLDDGSRLCLVALSDNNVITVALIQNSNVLKQIAVTLSNIQFENISISSTIDSAYACRSIMATSTGVSAIAITIIGNRTSVVKDPHMDNVSDSCDEVISLLVDVDKGKVVSKVLKQFREGTIIRINHWSDDAIAIGMYNHTKSSFEVVRYPFKLAFAAPDGSNDVMSRCTTNDIITIPEICMQFSTITSAATGACTAIGLSSRNRLYCGDSLIMVGASSFSINEPLDMLLYTTVGTRPHMHFVALSTLLSLDQLHAGADQYIMEAAEPRPIERGSKLVACVSGNSRVVVQLPRGNLEAFEPRPLVMIKARQLLDKSLFLDCLKLLRRQKVDLNLIVDHNQKLFFDSIRVFITDAVARSNCELLCLLISSIDGNTNTHASAATNTLYTGDEKVNQVCNSIRTQLLPLLKDNNNDLRILNPILCTYTKEKPSKLSDALTLIRNTCTVSCNSSTICQSKLHAAIKYIVFLYDGNLIFDEALGCCDYDMAKSIARQCQMDPKVYLPLLDKFECIGKGCNPDSVDVCFMHYSVNVHLKRYDRVLDYGIKTIQAYSAVDNADSTGSSTNFTASNINDISAYMLKVTKDHNLYEYILPKLSVIAVTTDATATTVSATCDDALIELLSSIRSAYGHNCVSNNKYAEAIVAFLSTSPVMVADAIKAARADNNWSHALLIASRYGSSSAGSGSGSDYSPRRVAQDIVSSFKEVLEQGESGLFEGNSSIDASTLHTSTGSDITATSQYTDKCYHAAQLCLDYLDDTEGAVEILLLARKLSEACTIAIRRNRLDLVTEDITVAARSNAIELIQFIKDKSKRVKYVVDELKHMWIDPDERLNQVASTEKALMTELQHNSNTGVDGDDTKSEFSMQSYRSDASYMSGLSNNSRSGTSTLSILSTLSTASDAKSVTSTSSFGIEGLAHSLLSRGSSSSSGCKADGGKEGKKYKEGRKGKRDEKLQRRGVGKDIWGLHKEKDLCDELWMLGNIRQLVLQIRDLTDTLLLLSSSSSSSSNDLYVLACDLQDVMDVYINDVKANTPPVAPSYPIEWLHKRQMLAVQRFQEAPQIVDNVPYASTATHTASGNENGNDTINNQLLTSSFYVEKYPSWLNTVIAGIESWLKVRKVSFLRKR